MLQRLLAISFAGLIVCASAFGQATTSLRGTVTDPQGASVAAAVLTLTDAATGSIRKVVADKSGEYQFLQIVPGTYSSK